MFPAIYAKNSIFEAGGSIRNMNELDATKHSILFHFFNCQKFSLDLLQKVILEKNLS